MLCIGSHGRELRERVGGGVLRVVSCKATWCARVLLSLITGCRCCMMYGLLVRALQFTGTAGSALTPSVQATPLTVAH